MLKQALFTVLVIAGAVTLAAPSKTTDETSIILISNGTSMVLAEMIMSDFKQINTSIAQPSYIDTVRNLTTTTCVQAIWEAQARAQCCTTETTLNDEGAPTSNFRDLQKPEECTSVTTCTHSDGNQAVDTELTTSESGRLSARGYDDTCTVVTTCKEKPETPPPAACPAPHPERSEPICQRSVGLFACDTEVRYGPSPENSGIVGKEPICCCKIAAGGSATANDQALWNCLKSVPGDVCIGGETFPNGDATS